MVYASGTVWTASTSLLLLMLILLPEITSPKIVLLLVKETVPSRSITIQFITPPAPFSETLPPVTLKITFAGVTPPVKSMLAEPSVMPPAGMLITNDWLAEPFKVKVVPFPRLIPAARLITFSPGTVALMVVVVVMADAKVWFAVSPARFAEAVVALLAAVAKVALPAAFEIVVLAIVPLALPESLLPVNL